MAPVALASAAGRPLLVFEPAEAYAAHSRPGWWGPVTSSIDWCERNYVVTPLVAEFFNTLSNAGMVCLGLVGMWLARREGLELRYVLANFSLFLIGLGSAAFHGTLTHLGQQGDETPMVIGSLIWIWCLTFSDPSFEARHRRLGPRCAWALAALATIFACLHYKFSFVAIFQGLIAILVVIMIVALMKSWIEFRGREQLRRYVFIYLGSILIALPLWLIDQHFCSSLHSLPGGLPNPQFHAWWHLLMGVNCYTGKRCRHPQKLASVQCLSDVASSHLPCFSHCVGQLLQVPIRLSAQGEKFRLGHWGGFLPYIQLRSTRNS